MDYKIFKAYDIRGLYPVEIDEEGVNKIAKALSAYLKPTKIVLGRDVRLSSPSLWQAAADGFTEMGVDVVDVGVISTDMLYFAVANYGFDGGMSITASHNPAGYNGMKIIGEQAKPISSTSGLEDIKQLVQKNDFVRADKKGIIEKLDIFEDYIQKVLSFVNADVIRENKYRVSVNPNFGTAGKAVQRLANELELELEKANFEPDGNFPKGRPDPMIPELRVETKELVKNTSSNLGASWDADADRCFLYDEMGRFVDAYYTGTLIAKILLERYGSNKVVHAPCLTWATDDIVREMGGETITIRAGHTFFKDALRKENAIFGMETSGHFFFRDYFYCDNGMIPFLLILEEMAKTGKKLSELIDPIRYKYPVSEEVNFKVNDTKKVIKALEEKNKDGKIDYIDGLSVEYPEWRFNIRPSNTENLVRLNVEAKTREILDPMKAEIIKNIKSDLASE